VITDKEEDDIQVINVSTTRPPDQQEAANDPVPDEQEIQQTTDGTFQTYQL
jgi:hypothetical protein